MPASFSLQSPLLPNGLRGRTYGLASSIVSNQAGRDTDLQQQPPPPQQQQQTPAATAAAGGAGRGGTAAGEAVQAAAAAAEVKPAGFTSTSSQLATKHLLHGSGRATPLARHILCLQNLPCPSQRTHLVPFETWGHGSVTRFIAAALLLLDHVPMF
jgi:hypothetical protein